ncbi:MAG: SpoIID/LytB domain-containing protein [Planctomycetota bacterium]|nr:SpoIID/LytB domain-containing protein [Planctomycetota bacterium]
METGQNIRSEQSQPEEKPTIFGLIRERFNARHKQVEKRLQRAPFTVASSGLCCLVLLSVFSCMGPQPKSNDSANKQAKRTFDGEPWIRVLIVENAKSADIAIKGLCAIHTADPKTGKVTAHAPVKTLDGLATSTVRPDGEAVVIEGQARYSGAIALRPQGRDAITVNGNRFRGELVIKSTSKGLRLINELPLEDYLCGVLGKEMPLSFPKAALEAQAVAARTYALFHLRSKKGKDHDVKNDTRSQVYGGLAAENKTARAVIEKTRGMVAKYNGEIFQTYFHSTCGGLTVPAAWIFGGKEFQPLSGAKCGRCISSKYYRWEKKMTQKEMLVSLRKRGFNIVAPVSEISFENWEKGRYKKSVIIKHAGGSLTIPAAKFRFAVGMRSTAFSLTKNSGGQVEFEGEGWGHGVGLCQVGAKGFAKEGLNGVGIIGHFYPGAEVTKIY